MLIHFVALFMTSSLLAASPMDLKKVKAKPPQGELVSTAVGEVAGKTITSRGVLLNSVIEDILFRQNSSKLQQQNYKSKAFIKETSAVLLEEAIWIESKGFPVATVSDEEFRQKKQLLQHKVKTAAYSKLWKSLQPTNEELDEKLMQKLSAKKLLQFKADSATLPVSDEEAKNYFKNNQFKFEKLPYENFRDGIKKFLSERQVEDRLREWFDVLKLKYRIQNNLIGKDSATQ